MGAMEILYLVTVLGVVLVSMILHELAHGFIALKLGDETARLLGRLSFNPLKHIDPYMTVGLPMTIAFINLLTGANMPIFGGAKPVPVNSSNLRSEWAMAVVAIAGPIVNLVLAFLFFAIAVSFNITPVSLLGVVLYTAVKVNLGFFAFNIIPIPPLDGSRVLYALAPDFVREIMDTIERYGAILILLVVLLFNQVVMLYMSNAINAIVAIFARILGVA
jgi:Zn-dependent protease